MLSDTVRRPVCAARIPEVAIVMALVSDMDAPSLPGCARRILPTAGATLAGLRRFRREPEPKPLFFPHKAIRALRRARTVASRAPRAAETRRPGRSNPAASAAGDCSVRGEAFRLQKQRRAGWPRRCLDLFERFAQQARLNHRTEGPHERRRASFRPAGPRRQAGAPVAGAPGAAAVGAPEFGTALAAVLGAASTQISATAAVQFPAARRRPAQEP
jgi:hypothetical protein